jgi:hypothetical protein
MNMKLALPILIITCLLIETGDITANTTAQVSNQEMRQQRIRILLSVLRDVGIRENSPQEVVKAIYELRDLRSAEAIDGLVPLLCFKQTFDWEVESHWIIDRRHPVPPDDRYPAIGALIRIGKPALASLINVIESQEEESLACKNAIYAITSIFLDDLSAASDYLKRAAANSSSMQSETRLLNAAAKLESDAAKRRR